MFFSKPWSNFIWRGTRIVYVLPKSYLWWQVPRCLWGVISTVLPFTEGLSTWPPPFYPGITSISFHWSSQNNTEVRCATPYSNCCRHTGLAFLDPTDLLVLQALALHRKLLPPVIREFLSPLLLSHTLSGQWGLSWLPPCLKYLHTPYPIPLLYFTFHYYDEITNTYKINFLKLKK